MGVGVAGGTGVGVVVVGALPPGELTPPTPAHAASRIAAVTAVELWMIGSRPVRPASYVLTLETPVRIGAVQLLRLAAPRRCFEAMPAREPEVENPRSDER